MTSWENDETTSLKIFQVEEKHKEIPMLIREKNLEKVKKKKVEQRDREWKMKVEKKRRKRVKLMD